MFLALKVRDIMSLIDIFDSIDRSLITVKHQGERILRADASNDEFVQKVVKETKYIDWPGFIGYLESSFKQFAKRIGDQPFLVYLPDTKFSSEHVFVAWLWQMIKNLNFQGFVSIEDNIWLASCQNVLFIDDAIYSGHNIIGSIDELSYKKNLTLNCYIVVACSSTDHLDVGLPYIKEELFTSLIVPEISTEGTKFAKYADSLTPLYFDHKVAGVASTFTEIYRNLMVLPPDDQLKYSLYKQYFEGVIQPPVETNHGIICNFLN